MMHPNKKRPAIVTDRTGAQTSNTPIVAAPPIDITPRGEAALVDTVLALLDGCSFANAMMPYGRPAPIRLPADLDARRQLARTHVRGEASHVITCIDGRPEQPVALRRTILASFSPDDAGDVRWLGIDLDAADGHGERGLRDPVRAMQALSERADVLGLGSGLLAARSQGGRGRHLRLILAEPVSLTDAIIAVALWASMAARVAQLDAEEGEIDHALQRGDGSIASPGDSGAFELYPRSDERPRLGWALALPGAGALADHGGGVLVDPFTDRRTILGAAPRCRPAALERMIAVERPKWLSLIHRRPRPLLASRPAPGDVLERTHPETQTLLAGCSPAGSRNHATFAAMCNLLGLGVDADEAERMVLAGAVASGLKESEARHAIRSARRRKGVAR